MAVLVGALALTASSMHPSPTVAARAAQSGVTLTLYNAQHVPLAEAWAADFTKMTGIKVQMRSASDYVLANQLVQEGDASPADLFITENSPAMVIVSNAGLFAPTDAGTRAAVPAQWQSPVGDWVGIAARTTVFVYNPVLLPSANLPKSMMDLSDPSWKDRIGVAPAGADFQAIVSAVLQLRGSEETAAWLAGLRNNARAYGGNRAVMAAANSSEIEGGIIYHYYFFGDRADTGSSSRNVELHYFGNQDPGAFVSVSGGGVLKSSKYPAEAQQLLAYITSERGQNLLSGSKAMEYSVASGVPAHPALKPLIELNPPLVDISALNGPEVVNLMQRAGLI